jgi:hypothetical protein
VSKSRLTATCRHWNIAEAPAATRPPDAVRYETPGADRRLPTALNASDSRSLNDTQKERRDPLNRKNGEAHILACYFFASYGNHKIRAAIPTKMATKIPGIIATSMTTSWVDGGFDYGFR